MKPSWCVLAAGTIALLSAADAATFNDNAETEQLAHAIAASTTAIACHLRTAEWGKAMLLGYMAGTRLGVMSEHPDAGDDEIDAEAADIMQAAEAKAALNAQFAAPTKAQCDTLNASQDLKEMDAAAKIGLMLGTINNQ